jgi:hypothetical protein
MRAKLAIKTCQAATDHGYTIVVVDGSPSSEFKAALRGAGAIVCDQIQSGMGASRREALRAGLDFMVDASVVVWLEPEKYPIVPLLEDSIGVVINERAEVVIPYRLTFTNYPAYQAESEVKANAEIAMFTGRRDLDYYIGPRIMTRRAAELMAEYDGKIAGQQVYGDKWEILFIPLLWFMAKGWWIDSFAVDYIHPIEQLVEDDDAMRAKRDEQRKVIVGAMRQEAVRLRLAA